MAYVLDPDGTFPSRVNIEMVDVEGLDDSRPGLAVHDLLEQHHERPARRWRGNTREAWTPEASSFRKAMAVTTGGRRRILAPPRPRASARRRRWSG